MAIAFRNQTLAGGSTGTSTTGTEPTGTTQDDIIIGLYVVDTASATLNIPSGWTSIYNGTSVSSQFRYNLCYIVRGASAPSYAFTHTGSVYRELFLLTYSGVDTATPINASVNGGSASVNPSNANAPSASATVANTMVLAVGIGWNGSDTGGWTAPSGYTIRSSNSAGLDSVVAEKALATATAEDPGAFANALNTGAGDTWQATVILDPIGAAAAGTPLAWFSA